MKQGIVRHALTLVQVMPLPVVPVGHAPQEKPVPGAGTSVQVTPVKQGLLAQPSMSVQVTPLPLVPAGHAPQVRVVLGGAKSVQVTPAQRPETQ